MKLTPPATLNVRLANSRNGITGSLARRSMTRNSPPSTRLAATSETMTGDPHANCAPPQVVNSTRQEMAAARTAKPR